jgi:UDP-N-acetylglucosamine 2-epimerase (non-hydrolysing)
MIFATILVYCCDIGLKKFNVREKMKKILVVFGTRPEAIKMAPLVHGLQKYSDRVETRVCVTAQHRQMLDQVLDIFGIKPDYDLDIMKTDQDLYDITEGIIHGMKNVFASYRPDLICVHGDTTTAFAAALSAFYEKVPIAHVEAGLRSGDLCSPWPEEANRKLISVLASLHFTPTSTSKKNLLNENVKASAIHVTGNTVIDALLWMVKKIADDPHTKVKVEEEILTYYDRFSREKRFILITGHRRENFGEGFLHICQAIRELALSYPEVDFIYPVHLNPNVQKPVYDLLSKLDNVYLIKPLEYEVFAYLMQHCYLVLTDSGGIQEEAPSLGKPVLIMRENTERPEALASGTVKLVGTDRQKIIAETSRLLEESLAYEQMKKAVNPYGDGTAAEKIIKVIVNTL